MSRRTVYWRKVLGAPAAGRIGKKPMDTHQTGYGGLVEAVRFPKAMRKEKVERVRAALQATKKTRH